MDVLRARAYLDLLLGQDSRPATPGPQTPLAGAALPAQVRPRALVRPAARQAGLPARSP
jgi:hypothetical protein